MSKIDDLGNPVKTSDLAGEAEAIASGANAPIEGEKPKRRGRPKGSTNKAIKPSGETQLSAQMINGVFFGACVVIGGEDAAPEPDEKKMLDGYLAGYLETKENFTVSPGLALALVYGQYAVGKLGKKTVKDRLQFTLFKIGRWARDKWKGFKERKGQHEPDDNQADRGRPSGGSGNWIVGPTGKDRFETGGKAKGR